mgnify:CR=1 FL=1
MSVFDFNDVEEVAVIWFVSDGLTFDWAACVLKTNGSWLAKTRFRYYRGDTDPFAGTDNKSEYHYTHKSRDTLIAATDESARRAAVVAGPDGRSDRLVVNGDGRKALETLMKQPWCHVKISPLPPGGRMPS